MFIHRHRIFVSIVFIVLSIVAGIGFVIVITDPDLKAYQADYDKYYEKYESYSEKANDSADRLFAEDALHKAERVESRLLTYRIIGILFFVACVFFFCLAVRVFFRNKDETY